MRVPKTQIAVRNEAVGRLGADFAQIYFPSRNTTSLQESYDSTTTLDPWHRASRYPPIVHFACAWTLCRLPFGYASFVHIFAQFVLFVLCFSVAFWVLEIRQYLMATLYLVLFCLFLTPVGLSWFERGQFSLYVALAYLWLLLGLVKRKKLYVALSAVFAFVKWTSFPCVFVILSVYMLNTRCSKEFKEGVILVSIFTLIIAALFLSFPKAGLHYVQGLYSQEFYDVPQGISLSRLMPKHAVKLVPLLLICMGYGAARRNGRSFSYLTPYIIGTAIILMTYPTIAFDYSMPALLGLIPILLHWASLPEIADKQGRVLQYGFLAFMIVGSLSIKVLHSETLVVIVYMGFSIAILFSQYLLYCPREVTAGHVGAN